MMYEFVKITKLQNWFLEYNKKKHRSTFCSEQIMEGVKADTRWINDVYEQVKWNDLRPWQIISQFFRAKIDGNNFGVENFQVVCQR